MTTSAVPMPASRPLPGRRYDRVFFPIFTALFLITVLIGFSRTYYAAGLIHAPLPNRLIHIHAIVFSSWLLMLIAQTGLVSARRVDIHKKLGILGFGIASLMVILGLLASRDSMLRGFAPPGLTPQIFFVVPVTDMFVFATLIYFAWALRSNSAAHKRLIMIANIGIIDAAVDRWPFAFIQHGSPQYANLCIDAFLLLIIAYDLWSTHKVHRATIWGGLLVLIVQQLRIPLAFTAPWQHFANTVLGK